MLRQEKPVAPAIEVTFDHTSTHSQLARVKFCNSNQKWRARLAIGIYCTSSLPFKSNRFTKL
ncbi:hypothetical protein Mapa_004152 [Marchantia paleacea]|nr:hypothetical protein Mapa_004152 [Marchantia paleacea]